MAKQSCDPFRSAEGTCVGFVRPGVLVTKGDLMARDPIVRTWVVPFSEVATVALAHTNFLGVANATVPAEQPDRRLVISTEGKYMFPLVTAAEVILGDYVIPVLNAGSTAVRAQEWDVSTTSAYAIGAVSKCMPDHDFYYGGSSGPDGLRTTAALEADDEVFTLTADLGLAVGDYVRIMYTSGTIANCTVNVPTIVKVKAAATGTTCTLETIAGSQLTTAADIASSAITIETVQGARSSDEAEAAISSTLMRNV